MPVLSKIGAACLAAFGFTSGASAVTTNYLLVAGGGGGSGESTSGTVGGAGGGAGGMLTGTTSLSLSTSYTIIVGAGGGAGIGQVNGSNGSNSTLGTLTAAVGGGGGGTTATVGLSGGSGGGGGRGSSPAGGSGTSGQGNAGGAGGSNYGSGGGGGAGAVGQAGTTTSSGNGGNGLQSSITGTATYYAGGGGGGYGGNPTQAYGTGGLGGGADGAHSAGTGYNGTANLGGGGGGASSNNSTNNGGAGGSGVIIISYVGVQKFGGGVVTTDGTNTIHTFKTSGTLQPINILSASYLMVGGGGGGHGNYSGGGGGGGFLTGTGLTIDTNSSYVITVGAGGTSGSNGTNSTISAVSTAAVGGGGGGYTTGNGNAGGSGGGAGNGVGQTGGAATSGQGNAGGASGGSATTGGGGGAGAVGGTGNGSNQSGAGGTGSSSSISGTATYYSGGGGGGGNSSTSVSGGAGGTGGGGAGATANATAGTNGTANTGGGSGGSSGGAYTPTALGGSGIVIISYPGTTQQMAGGSVTIVGGNVIHTFTSTGALTPIKYASNSLRFRSSASAYLSRTPSIAGNRQTWTWSAWVKRGTLGSTQMLFSNGNGAAGNGHGEIYFVSDDTLWFAGTDNGASYSNAINTNAVFRDPAAWYHIVVVCDTTNSTTGNRQLIYVNGSLASLTVTATVTQNANLQINRASLTAFGIQAITSGASYFDGYLSEVNFVDGQALTPNSFGSTNSYGVWQPITYAGSYGTNGFYLPFTYPASSSTITSSYLVVAGGGGGGSGNASYGQGGGGGAGGLVASTAALAVSATYTVTVGTGGAAATNGSNSVLSGSGITTVTAVGGGAGGSASSSAVNGSAGGSGGGGNSVVGPFLGTGGAGTASQGNAGGSGGINGSSYGAGGGGGSSVAGTTGGAAGGNGGSGTSSSISGTAVTYAGGGAGGVNSGTTGTGGSGGGGSGANGSATSATAGTANTGGGGGGGSYGLSTAGAGGSGVVIISYPGLIQYYTGGTVTQVAGNTIHTFTSSGTLAPNTAALGYDYSPQQNNWTPTNISLTQGYTYDSMTDSPTLTSATASNYCVLNPLQSATAPTNANLTLTGINNVGWLSALGSIGVNTGKYYWEVYVRAMNVSYNGGHIGIAQSTLIPAVGNYPGQTVASYGYRAAEGTLYHGSGAVAYGAAYTTGDTIGVALDMTSGTLTFYKNNVSQGVAGTGITGTWTPMIGVNNGDGGGGNNISDINFGQRPFTYTPPTGYVALNTYNLSTPTIPNGRTVFDATTYSGNNTARSISNIDNGTVGFKPDLVWIKDRTNTASHALFDSVRGSLDLLSTNNTNAAGTAAGTLTGFNSNGFSLGSDTTYQIINYSGSNYVGWQWQAGQGVNTTNTDGSITSTVSANQTAGFSVVKWTATSGTQTIGHGLGTTPQIVLVKDTSNAADWIWFSTTITGSLTFIHFNLGFTYGNAGETAPTSTVFNYNGTTGHTFVAYCWAQVAGFSSFGKYVGNGSADGPFVYTGFRPKFVLVKCATSNSNWMITDSARSPYNVSSAALFPNVTDVEYTLSTYVGIDLLSNGFKIRSVGGEDNLSGQTHVYMAFAENPFKFANGR